MSDAAIHPIASYTPPSLDYQFTNNAHYRFFQDCTDRLEKASREGKGFFIHANISHLEKLLLKAVEDRDWTSVSNYAMMISTHQEYWADFYARQQ